MPTIQEIQQALAGPLPGMAGQIKMAPQPLDGQVNRGVVPDDHRQAGVLLLLYPHTSAAQPELHLVLMRRNEYPGVHSGQISFPGGQREGDEALQKTALRETREEMGIMPETVEVIGQLSPLYTPTSNFYIFPFVAFSPNRPRFRPDPKEVAELIEAPLKLLLNPATRQEEIWHLRRIGQRRVPFYRVYGHYVWGATAMILGEFLTLLAR
ncbi:MAG: CoA pyrophosphatase [Anaerolineae bacterium]|nr:CoA pyrophosphatase [Anaerolineae bacterium]